MSQPIRTIIEPRGYVAPVVSLGRSRPELIAANAAPTERTAATILTERDAALAERKALEA